MSSTNKTTNYELSQFLGSDKPAWLVDYNGDMQKIDTQMKANAEAAAAAQTKANTADGKADANAIAIQTLDGEINGATGLASDVATLAGGLNTVTSLIGNGEPTTTDKTLIGAINELNTDINGAGGTEEKIGNLSNLTTTEKSSLVGAINELNAGNILGSVSITTDGVMSFGDMLNQFKTLIDFTKLRAESYLESTIGNVIEKYRLYETNIADGEAKFSNTFVMDNNTARLRDFQIRPNTNSKQVDIIFTPGTTPAITLDESTSFVPSAGRVYTIVY